MAWWQWMEGKVPLTEKCTFITSLCQTLSLKPSPPPLLSVHVFVQVFFFRSNLSLTNVWCKNQIEFSFCSPGRIWRCNSEKKAVVQHFLNQWKRESQESLSQLNLVNPHCTSHLAMLGFPPKITHQIKAYSSEGQRLCCRIGVDATKPWRKGPSEIEAFSSWN